MKKRKTDASLLLRQSIVPRYKLGKAFLVFLGGLFLLLLGLYLSFKHLFGQLFEAVGETWETLVLASGSTDVATVSHLVGGLLLLTGIIVAILGARAFLNSIDPKADTGKAGSGLRTYIRRQQLLHGPRIVALGGGTGLSTLLRGLKHHSSNITAIVTVTDDGGSSGRLVQDFGILPPGDLRNCLVALADAEKGMTDLLQHRFSSSSKALGGHTVGNLLLAGLMEQSGGDIDQALSTASEVLAIRGRVVPATKERVVLKAIMSDEQEIIGETAIVGSGKSIRRIKIEPEAPAAHPDAIRAIQEADLICLGPGSVYTSIIPNLLVPEIAEAIHQSKATRVFICNVMTQKGESDSFAAFDHVRSLTANVPKRVFDYVLVNNKEPSQAASERYKSSGQVFVQPDIERIHESGYKAVSGNLISETDLVRHDPARVAARLMELLGI